ncbi:MAG: cation:dicarboxylase symporter family transporter [Candidatus Sericytochromatia bacterium]|nr:cation:dicarboxylase symporter family transporter [Candidatus Sericytochromatia bacterium]
MRLPSLTTRILIGLIAGIAVGYLFPALGTSLKPLSDLFMHLIKMIVVPLIFGSLIMGIAGAGDFKHVGRIGAKALLYFEAATTLALIIGLAVANVLRPGAGASAAMAGATDPKIATAATAHIDWGEFLVHLVPTNVVDAMARGDTLQIVVFATIFGVATAAIGIKGKPVLELAHSVTEVMFKVTEYVMKLAPIGVFAATAVTVGKFGLTVLLPLSKLILSLYAALAIFLVILLGIVCRLIRVPAIGFFKHISEPFLLAFSTASSEAALPQAMTKMEAFGVPKSIVTFVMPTGYTFNLDGTTLYLALATLFIAQVYGIDLSLMQQLAIMATLMLSSKGVAAVPGASLVILTGTLTAFNLPVEGVALILGVDRLLDMARTSVNLLGNCLATAVVARWEKAFDDTKMAAALAGDVEAETAVPA